MIETRFRIGIKLSVLIACFAVTVVSLLVSNYLERLVPDFRPAVSALAGLLIGALLGTLIGRTRKTLGLARVAPRSLNRPIAGAIFGAVAITVSFAIIKSETMIPGSLNFMQIVSRFLYEVRPALIEELGFRLGLVSFTLSFFGRTSAVLAGSLPFGILHLLNFISGQTIDWQYIFGTSVAGLFLTLVFLVYGFGAAFLAHYTWNVCAALLSLYYGISQEKIEGSFATLTVLIFLSLFLLLSGQLQTSITTSWRSRKRVAH